ncbi:MAG: long-chain fatty acid--CoA ligase [Curvibacter lanceolatus]|nr:long-chain fatty acid--CoA ligase [Curvibacter lanceolatus]
MRYPMKAFPWIASYPEGARWDMALSPRRVDQLLSDAARRWPAQPALDFQGRRMSYQELDRRVDELAAGLQYLGVGPGVHVGLYLPNTPHYVVSFFAVLRAGGTVVNYSPLDARNTIAHKIEDSETDLLFTLDLPALYGQVHDLPGQTRLRHLLVGSLDDFGADEATADAHLRQDAPYVPTAGPQVLRYAALFRQGARPVRSAGAGGLDEIAVLQYTGGTTGHPKGAMLSHANLSAATDQVSEVSSLSGEQLKPGQERMLVALPLFHVYAMVVNLLMGVKLGAELVLVLKFDPGQILHDIATKRISCFPGVPTMFTALVNHPDAARYDLHSLKTCASGGAPLPVELLHQFEAMSHCMLSEGWGMTETSSIGTFTPTTGLRKPGACGIPSPQVEIRILRLGGHDEPVPVGEIGEIVIAGPQVMQGYWKNPQATRDSFTADGFFRTGDVGRLDADGFLTLVDRSKDMLLCSGFNVYPRVIEEAIYTHPRVREVMVIGQDDPYRGQSPKAYVSLRQAGDTLTLEELQAYLRDHLGKHEMVQALELRAELPKTAVGKLSKQMLREELTQRP